MIDDVALHVIGVLIFINEDVLELLSLLHQEVVILEQAQPVP